MLPESFSVYFFGISAIVVFSFVSFYLLPIFFSTPHRRIVSFQKLCTLENFKIASFLWTFKVSETVEYFANGAVISAYIVYAAVGDGEDVGSS